MIKVYFGPWRHSPAKPISGDESHLTIGEFHLLRGYDRDFWTNNPFVLDCFRLQQIMVWDNEWIPLDEAVKRVIPPAELESCVSMAPGKQALAFEVMRLVDLHASQSENGEIDVEKVKAEIRAALLH